MTDEEWATLEAQVRTVLEARRQHVVACEKATALKRYITIKDDQIMQ